MRVDRSTGIEAGTELGTDRSTPSASPGEVTPSTVFQGRGNQKASLPLKSWSLVFVKDQPTDLPKCAAKVVDEFLALPEE